MPGYGSSKKFKRSRGEELVFPQVCGTIADAWRHVGIVGPDELDGSKIHDCFTATEYRLSS